eukprot:TRINITY_DN4343_c0_g1_i3.p1 TRINITY_DN4343_c0_g1~~TRINITY_DN4343_c0_g1_i3.p1  ORF type:complete len:102 (-),score=0.80 TRINITY_DN4343_c0_g1_i3:91-396(-)
MDGDGQQKVHCSHIDFCCVVLVLLHLRHAQNHFEARPFPFLPRFLSNLPARPPTPCFSTSRWYLLTALSMLRVGVFFSTLSSMCRLDSFSLCRDFVVVGLN